MASKPWYEVDQELYAKVRLEVENFFPELRFIERDQDILLTGCYPLFEGDQVYDRYAVEIKLQKGSARGLPEVREVGGRIPHNRDRHINEEDGAACIVLPDAFWNDNPDGISLLDFLNGPMRSFFASQSLVELGHSNPWPAGEWKHGVAGIIDFYSNLVQSKEAGIILRYLELMARDSVKGHWHCPCGSGQKLRKCHQLLIQELRSRIPRAVVAMSARRILISQQRTGKILPIQ